MKTQLNRLLQGRDKMKLNCFTSLKYPSLDHLYFFGDFQVSRQDTSHKEFYRCFVCLIILILVTIYFVVEQSSGCKFRRGHVTQQAHDAELYLLWTLKRRFFNVVSTSKQCLMSAREVNLKGT